MNELTNVQQNRVVKLSGSTLGNATTTITILRVLNAVNINSSGGLVFQFANSDIDERAFYDNFFFNASQYPENEAQAQSQYFRGVLSGNPDAFTLEEIAFLAKTMVQPNWTYPIVMSWEQWESICKTNTVAFPVLFSQLTPTGEPPTGTGNNPNDDPNNPNYPNEPGNTGTGSGNGSGIPVIQQETQIQKLIGSIPSGFWWSIAGGILVYFITRSIQK